MLAHLKSRFMGLFRGAAANSTVTERSSLTQITKLYPSLPDFLHRRYALKLQPGEDQGTLGDLVALRGLPPAQVVFMEMQLDSRSERVPQLSARIAAEKVIAPEWRVLDVREPWEHQFGGLPKARPMDSKVWNEILEEWDRGTPILLYCHFGIRSQDAAGQLLDRGFKNVHVLQGGIDAWSQDVDPKVSRYEGSWC